MSQYAQHFYEIEETIEENDEIRERALELVADEPIPEKVTEGGDRGERLREILISFFEGNTTYQQVTEQIWDGLPRRESPHSHDNRIFAKGWEERLARTQISRFYNKAVLEILLENGEDEVYVPHSDHEDHDSPCTIDLAGGTADIQVMLDRLDRTYRDGEWHDEVMIPEHPHCTHTFIPVE